MKNVTMGTFIACVALVAVVFAVTGDRPSPGQDEADVLQTIAASKLTAAACCQSGRNAAAKGGCCQSATQSQSTSADTACAEGEGCQGGQCAACAGEAAQTVTVAQRGRRGPPPGRGPGRGMGRGPGGGNGDNSRFAEDHDVFFFLLDQRDKINRTITNLPNGIETVTESDDEEVIGKIQEHVASMYDRVENANPIHMRDPLFRELFANAKKINMEMKDTPNGVWVRETSTDPYVAKLLQEHAKTVALFIKNGRSELHRNHPLPNKAGDPPATDGELGCMACQLNSFADFDKRFIPALALTKQEKPGPARAAMVRLTKRWEGLKPMLGECRSEWTTDLNKVDEFIASATALAAEGKLLAAHEELEEIRDIFMELRREGQVVYQLDTLNRFHAIIEDVVKPALTMKPNDVDDSVRKKFAAAAAEAMQAWDEVRQTSFDAPPFALNDARLAKLTPLIAVETAKVETFAQVVKGDDSEAILVAARDLQPGFAKVFMFFGDFPEAELANR